MKGEGGRTHSSSLVLGLQHEPFLFFATKDLLFDTRTSVMRVGAKLQNQLGIDIHEICTSSNSDVALRAAGVIAPAAGGAISLPVTRLYASE